MTTPTMAQTKDHIVIIEDDPSNQESYRRLLSRAGYRVSAFRSAEEGLEELRRSGDVALIITDLMLPGGKSGMNVLEEARRIEPRVGLLMITGHGSVPLAVEAMKHGADEFLLKPIEDIEQLRLKVGSILKTRRLERENLELRSRITDMASFGGLIGRAGSMQRLYRQIEMVAPTRSTVLIIGESGTGKELVANALHEHSPRRHERFLPINCGAIPGEILESELFGHEKGSFTGAASRKIGKFELADRGSIFLDEIGELPPDMQVKLLRVLEGTEFMRVGGTETIRVDVRVIAATNSDLEAAVGAGRFRSDLYYRLKVVTIRIPPLRERREDVPILIQSFLERFASENARPAPVLTPATLRALVNHPWEGNVRELKNLIESLVVLAPSTTIDLPDLPVEYQRWVSAPSPAGAGFAMMGGGLAGGPGPISGSWTGPGGSSRGDRPEAVPVGERGPYDRAESAWMSGREPAEAARAAAAGGGWAPGGSHGGGSAPVASAPRTMDEIEREAILAALREANGNRTKAAERLGIGLRTLQRKLKEYKSQGAI